MKKASRFVSAVLALALCSLMVTGCQSTPPSSAAPADSNASAVPTPPQEKPTEISIFFPNTKSIDRNGGQLKTAIEKATNTKLTFIEAPGKEWRQKLAALFASNTAPDLFFFEAGGTEKQEMDSYGAEGFLAPLNDIYATKLPDANKVVPEQLKQFIAANDGTIYGVPTLRDIGYASYFVRTDWLQNLNMSQPKTLDEFKEVMRAFKEDDPDKNGKDDTYACGFDVSLFTGPFGMIGGEWLVEGDAISYMNTRPEMKDAWAFAREAIEKGWVHPDTISGKGVSSKELASSGVIGLWQSVSSDNATREAAIKQLVPAATTDVLPVPVAPGIEKGYSSGSLMVENINNKPKALSSFCAISSKIPADKLDKVYEFVNWAYTKEGNSYLTYGIEGVTYEKTADGGYNFLPEYVNSLDKLQALGAWDIYHYAGYIEQRANWHQLWPESTVKNMSNTWVSAYPKQVYFNSETGNKIIGEVNAKYEELLKQVVSGSITVDAGWEAWIKEFNRLGGEQWIKEMQEIYVQRSKNK